MRDDITGTTFGVWLKQRRKDQGIGPDQFAELIGCSTITLLKIEAGERRPSRQVALLLAQLLNIPADEQEAFTIFARTGREVALRAGQETQLGEIAARAPWRASRLQGTNLPHLLTPLIGRESDEWKARELLLQSKVRLLTLTGAPGIGKTRLALQIASDALDHFEDGVFLVELAPVNDPGEVLAATARTLGLKESSSQPVEETLFGYVRERRMLLVLDNLEHLLDATPSIVKLLECSPWLKVLVTSREALHVRGERRYLVPPLAIPDKAQLPIAEVLAGYASVELFVERAQAAEPDFRLTAENAYEVAAICAGLEGLPLAIELAAANAKYLSLQEMRAALERPLKLLAGGGRDLPHRQRTLRSAIEWSYGLLKSDEQRLFRRLSVFVGGFTLEAVEAIWNEHERESDSSLASAPDILRSLEEKSLVKRESGGDSAEIRFGLLEAIREYASEKLQKGGQAGEAEVQAQAVEKKHALYFMGLAEEAEPLLKGGEQAEWLDKLEREHGNLRAALAWSLGPAENAETALRLGAALWRFWWVRGYMSEGREWLARALVRGHSAPASIRARALYAAGNLAWVQGHHTAARALLEESLALSRELGDKAGIALSLNYLGFVMRAQGDYVTARALLEESLALSRELEDKAGIASSLNNLGILARSFEDQTAARALFEESLALNRLLGNQVGIAILLNNVGLVTRDQGDLVAARALFEESLALNRLLGNQTGIANSLSFLGHVTQDQGDLVAARTLFEESLELDRLLGSQVGIAGSFSDLASVTQDQRDYGAARTLFEESIALFREIGEKGSVAEVLRKLGNMLQVQGEGAAAREILEESLAMHRELGDRRGASHVLTSLGNTANMQGDYEEARSLYRQSLLIKVDVDDKTGVALSLARLGGLAAGMETDSEETLRGAKLLGASDALMEELGAVWPPEDRKAYEWSLASACEQLGEEAFGRAFAEGRAMAMEEAIQFALPATRFSL